MTDGPLARYRAMRDFAVTREPRGEQVQDARVKDRALTFVIQKHAASRLHYDFRLELGGVLVSWALPKGPSFDPLDKRMAIHVEDHPLSYGSFEGTIPPRQYGAGEVIVWDHGTWEPVGDPRLAMAAGKVLFKLHGHKLQGLWELVRIAKGGEKQEPWILFKKRDAFARPKSEYDVVSALPDSVIRKHDEDALTRAPKRNADALEDPPVAGRASRAAAADGNAKPTGAVKAMLPEKLSPQLATLAAGVPSQGEWIFEIKFDGYRIMARIDKGKARLITRGGHDWSAKMPALVEELEQLGLKSGWLDGEIVVPGANGTPDFNALQNAFDRGHGAEKIVYFLFDVPFFEGYDLRAVAQRDRRHLLKALLDQKSTEHVRFSADFEADPASILSSACRLNLEGVIAKRADAPYASRRTDAWLKLKCKLRQEFVVCGYTDRSDNSTQIGSLLLGVHAPDGQLVSAGSVGTGWDTDTAHELKLKLEPLHLVKAPFAAGPSRPGRWSKRAASAERWVQPVLVAEVTFAEWTPDGQIRHASFLSLRADKAADLIVRETAKDVGNVASRKSAPARTSSGVKVSHGERVIDAASGLTKLDLVRYYESVADFILPHLTGRPVSLVRGPQGVGGQLFFQKHGEKIGIPGITELDAALWPGHASLLEVGNAQALAGAAQLNVIEFHTWNSTKKAIDKPDRMIFDLDPGEGTTWEHIQEAASLTRTLLSALGLQAWLKTSGGKGLHVVVPLAPRTGYDTVNAFSKAIVQHLAQTIPSRFVAKSGPANRIGKLFVDYLRNGHGATTAAAFSARARPGLGVSMPVAWDDLVKLKGGAQWTIATAREHLSFQKIDPWADYWKAKQTLSRPMQALGFKPGR
ncbi:MAG: ligase [Variovorax sp.]|jgi:bifunctional non-homologous end joining protein LigD|nr:ligase [Variovorax sp.]